MLRTKLLTRIWEMIMSLKLVTGADMFKNYWKLLAMRKCSLLPCILAASMALTGCGGSSSGDGNSQSSASRVSASSLANSSLMSSSSSLAASSSLPASSAQSSSSVVAIEQYLSVKRGLAYGHHSPADLAAMQYKVKWWYNWGITPEAAVADNYVDYGFDYVPMTWGANFNENNLRNFLNSHPNVKYLLGFNEPNFSSQANLTPQQAADLWPTLEAIAADYDLKLVAPAVNYSPGDVDIPGTNDDWSPWEYLDAFLAACEGCQVDYIAVHSYMKYSGAFEWYIGEFERYNLPIWVTEWASWDEGGPANVNEQMNYLAATVRWMEANPKVYRYSWFIGRSDGGPSSFPYIDILAEDGELSPLGGLYTAIPATDYRYPVPGRIQAEGAHRQAGFTHQPTADNTGYVNLVSGTTAAWAEYDIEVETAGTYQLNFRLASALADRQIAILLDNTPLLNLTMIHTGGAQTWQTYTAEATLTAGEHKLRMETASGSLGVNWMEIAKP